MSTNDREEVCRVCHLWHSVPCTCCNNLPRRVVAASVKVPTSSWGEAETDVVWVVVEEVEVEVLLLLVVMVQPHLRSRLFLLPPAVALAPLPPASESEHRVHWLVFEWRNESTRHKSFASTLGFSATCHFKCF